MMSPRRHAVAALAVLAMVATACADAPGAGRAGAGQEGLQVVATTSILGDIVGNVAGDVADIEVLMPPGSDPHSFSPSAAQAAAVRDADLVVANGLGLEESLEDLLDAARADGATVLALAPELDPVPLLPGLADGDGDGDGDDHADAGLDAHVWFDPVRMADGVGLIADALAAVDDAHDEAFWTRRGADYATRLIALDEEIRDILGRIPVERRTLVTNHDAIGYLAHRYDLEVIGTVVPGGSTLAGASAEHLADLAALVRRADVPAIFAENTSSDRLAETLAREVGDDVEVVSLYTDALGQPGSGADTYIGMLRTDAEMIADALSR
jgi:zinc/manganese transport system substrate-binding protein